jgi:hypothetical protein
MLGVRLDKGVEEHTGAFDITNFGIRLDDDTVERSEVPLGVDRSREAR